HTYDVQIQQTLMAGSMNRVVWGAGERVNSYGIRNSTALLFFPASRSLTLSNLFIQNTFALSPTLSLTGGIKLEDDPYSGWVWQPDGRLSWMITPAAQLWAAASRAVRSPTPFDVDVVEKVAGTVFLTGNPDFHPERVDAYEIGYRSQPSPIVSFSVSAFFNHYEDLRTVETASSTAFIPLHWGNAMQGNTYGVEAWADVQLTDAWRMSPGVRTLHKDLRFTPGASGILDVAQAGNDPSVEASLRSALDLPGQLSFDASLRYVSALPDPRLPSYYELAARLAWQATHALEVALVGSNLLHARHLEYPGTDGEAIPRSFRVQLRWRP